MKKRLAAVLNRESFRAITLRVVSPGICRSSRGPACRRGRFAGHCLRRRARCAGRSVGIDE